jgi:hypothetical protein
MTETSTAARSPADALREAEATLSRLEVAMTKARQDVHQARVEVMRAQAKGVASSLQDSHIDMTLANLRLADAEGRDTRSSQELARARQEVDFQQRRHVKALNEARTINARVA